MYTSNGRQYQVDSFPDGTLRITEIYNCCTANKSEKKENTGKGLSDNPEKGLSSSICRAKSNIYDIVHSMNIMWFGTLTFSPDCKDVNREDIKDCKRYLGNFFQNLKRKYPDVRYLAIPELHKDKKGLHFHVCAENWPETDFVFSGIKQKGRKVFNNLSWHAGFTNFTKASNSQKCANYMLKYITKTLIETGSFGKQRYLVSKNIPRPQRLMNEFIAGINTMFQKAEDIEVNENGEYFPTAEEIANDLGNYEFCFEKPVDVVTNEFEYHAKRYFYKRKD